MTPVSSTSRPFVVMVKPVGSRCNLRCSYCYYLDTEQRLGLAPAARMDDETLECLIRQYIEDCPGTTVSFVWHGGEPALAGLNFYKKAVALQKRYKRPDMDIWNNLQTNGVLLDGEWCDFLAEEKFDVGVSVDGAAWIHDRFRKDGAGKGSYRQAVAAVERLKARGIRPDLLCTVTSDAAAEPLAVYRALRNLGTGWVQFIPIVRRKEDGYVTPDSVAPEDYGAFLSAVFDEWIFHDAGRTDVQLFAEMALVGAGGCASLCWMSPICGRALVVERDGSVYACDHFVRPEYRLGSVRTDRLCELADGSRQRTFGEAKRTGLTAQCRACRYLPLCGGGCPKDRFALSDSGEPGQYYLCAGLRSFFARAEDRLAAFIRLRKAGTPPADCTAVLRERERQKWEGVGRNDPCPCGSGKKAKQCCWNRKP